MGVLIITPVLVFALAPVRRLHDDRFSNKLQSFNLDSFTCTPRRPPGSSRQQHLDSSKLSLSRSPLCAWYYLDLLPVFYISRQCSPCVALHHRRCSEQLRLLPAFLGWRRPLLRTRLGDNWHRIS